MQLHTNHEVTAAQCKIIRAIAAARTAAWTFLADDAAYLAGAMRTAWIENDAVGLAMILDGIVYSLSACPGAYDAIQAIQIPRGLARPW